MPCIYENCYRSSYVYYDPTTQMRTVSLFRSLSLSSRTAAIVLTSHFPCPGSAIFGSVSSVQYMKRSHS
jgi:hypothetical protein